MELRINRKRLHSLFEEMVDLYSPSGKEEELADLLEARIQAAGLTVERQPVDETRSNLLISSGAGNPDRLFLGHIDTVPAYDIEHYGFTEKDGVVYGLGTADMKSGCAAMIEAFISAKEQGTLPDNTLISAATRRLSVQVEPRQSGWRLRRLSSRWSRPVSRDVPQPLRVTGGST